jgi:hypothetical protein
MRRKKVKNKEKENPIVDLSYEVFPEESPVNETTDVNSIEEFIEIKKLQNRLLEKMLNKINQSENQDKKNR